MTWFGGLRFGMWNAWIPMLVYLLLNVSPFLLDALKITSNLTRKMGEVPGEKKERIKNSLTTILLGVLFLYSFLLPLQQGSVWFFVGLLFWLLGLTFCLSALVTAAVTPEGRVFSSGVYRFSRHPLYLASSAVLLGVGLASVSGLFLLLSLVLVVTVFSSVNSEEQVCLETFGLAYQDYMKRTPRWIGWPGPMK